MDNSLYDTIKNITSGVWDSTKATKDSLFVANEAYHLQMAIRECGEAKVHQKATELLLEKNKDRNMTYSDASVEISGRIRGMIEATQGVKLFRETRDALNGGEMPAPDLNNPSQA